MAARIAIYDRISKAEDNSTSIARQVEACEAFARNKWGQDVELVHFVDEGISAYDPDAVRPAYERLLASVGELDGLVCYRVDRLTRRGARHLLELVEDVLAPAACVLVSATEPVDLSGPFGELFLTMLAIFARMESQRLSEKQQATWQHLTKVGRWRGGRPPYGYAKAPREGGGFELVPVEEEAQVIRDVARRIVEGEALLSIVRELNAQGIPYVKRRKNGGREETLWEESSLRYLLLNPAVAGYMAERGKRTVYFEGEPVRVAREPVLDPGLWRRVVELFEERRGTKPSRERSLLAGLLRCAHCGGAMVAKAGGKSPSYKCRTRHTVGPDACPGLTVTKTGLELYVTAALKAALPELLKRGQAVVATRVATGPDPSSERIAHLGELLQHLYGERDRLTLDEGRVFTDPSVASVTASIERARDERDALIAEQDRKRKSDRVHELGDLLDGVDLDEVGTDRLRRALSLVFHEVRVSKAQGRGVPFDPDRVELVLREG